MKIFIKRKLMRALYRLVYWYAGKINKPIQHKALEHSRITDEDLYVEAKWLCKNLDKEV